MKLTYFFLNLGTVPKPKKKKPIKSGKATSAPVFPVDFFEHCTAMNDVEFGGNDLLQIYNASQLKHRYVFQKC